MHMYMYVYTRALAYAYTCVCIYDELVMASVHLGTNIISSLFISNSVNISVHNFLSTYYVQALF